MSNKKKVEYAPKKSGGGYPFPVKDIKLPIKDCLRGNILVKAAYYKQDLNNEQLYELLRCEEDPVYFIKTYCRITSVDSGIIPFELFEYQEEIIKSFYENRFSINVLGRQMGKTTVVAAILLHFTLFNSDKIVAILANKHAQAKEIVSRIRQMYEYLPFFMQQGAVIYNKHSVKFENGSELFCASTSNDGIRGRSCVSGNTKIKIRNKKTGEIKFINIQEASFLLKENKCTRTISLEDSGLKIQIT